MKNAIDYFEIELAEWIIRMSFLNAKLILISFRKVFGSILPQTTFCTPYMHVEIKKTPSLLFQI